ncbi:MAG: hypothetical protein M1594_01895, partial [Candidatus Marsarchaeota archaeon]|nr:hypothetical protein [Candidatus Marsarchaeota archaeon]
GKSSLKGKYGNIGPNEIAGNLITDLKSNNLPFKFTATSDLASYLKEDAQSNLLSKLRQIYGTQDINEISSNVIRDYSINGLPAGLSGPMQARFGNYLGSIPNIDSERELLPVLQEANPDLIPQTYAASIGSVESLSDAAPAAASGLKGRVGSLFEKYKGALGCLAVQGGVQALTGVDVKPVEAILNQTATSHLVVYHIQHYYLWPNYASIYSMQFGNQVVYLTNFCNSSNSLCIRGWVPSSNQFILIVTDNNQNLDLSGIFNSIFATQTPPISNLPSGFVSGFVNTNDVNSLSGESDLGNEAGFGVAAPPSNLVAVPIKK